MLSLCCDIFASPQRRICPGWVHRGEGRYHQAEWNHVKDSIRPYISFSIHHVFLSLVSSAVLGSTWTVFTNCSFIKWRGVGVVILFTLSWLSILFRVMLSFGPISIYYNNMIPKLMKNKLYGEREWCWMLDYHIWISFLYLLIRSFWDEDERRRNSSFFLLLSGRCLWLLLTRIFLCLTLLKGQECVHFFTACDLYLIKMLE